MLNCFLNLVSIFKCYIRGTFPFDLKLNFVLLLPVVCLVLEFEPKRSKMISPWRLCCFFVAEMKPRDRSPVRKEEIVFASLSRYSLPRQGSPTAGAGSGRLYRQLSSNRVRRTNALGAQPTFSIFYDLEPPCPGNGSTHTG